MALKIYPVIKTENQCEDYKVKINGEQVELNTASVSTILFNRAGRDIRKVLSKQSLSIF